MCHPPRSAGPGREVNRLRGWSRRLCSNTSSNTHSTKKRRPSARRVPGRSVSGQAGCMAKTEKHRTAQRIPQEIARAIAAAEDKKAADMVLLDLRKAAGFADYFLICSGGNARSEERRVGKECRSR